jgi:glycosyltransferase involved in cell wall biosynthesis
MKISACIITYNHEPFLKECLEGAILQKLNCEYEIVIGEDCSTDNTLQICKEYADKYPHVIRLLPSKQNLGMIGNWNRTTLECKGEYIAICEGDDYWIDPLKLQKQVDFLEAREEYAGFSHQVKVLIDNKENRLFKQNVPSDIHVNDLIGGRLFHTASLVFRRTVLELYNNAPAVLSADRLLNFCIAFSGKIHFSNECMCVYRIQSSGLHSNATLKQMLLDLNSISYLKKIYPMFPKYQYLSYVYATIGLCKNGAFYEKVYYLFLSFLFSFSYFPKNIAFLLSNIRKRL